MPQAGDSDVLYVCGYCKAPIVRKSAPNPDALFEGQDELFRRRDTALPGDSGVCLTCAVIELAMRVDFLIRRG